MENWPLILLSMVVFFLGAVLGGSVEVPGLTVPSSGLPESKSPLFFLSRNAVVIVGLLAGNASFGVVTFFSLLANGASIGYAVTAGDTVLATVLLLLPHGLLEVPALWLAGAAGFKLPAELILYLIRRKSYIVDQDELEEIAVLAAMSFVLVTLAAVVESYVTPVLFAAVG